MKQKLSAKTVTEGEMSSETRGVIDTDEGSRDPIATAMSLRVADRDRAPSGFVSRIRTTDGA